MFLCLYFGFRVCFPTCPFTVLSFGVNHSCSVNIWNLRNVITEVIQIGKVKENVKSVRYHLIFEKFT